MQFAKYNEIIVIPTPNTNLIPAKYKLSSQHIF